MKLSDTLVTYPQIDANFPITTKKGEIELQPRHFRLRELGSIFESNFHIICEYGIPKKVYQKPEEKKFVSLESVHWQQVALITFDKQLKPIQTWDKEMVSFSICQVNQGIDPVTGIHKTKAITVSQFAGMALSSILNDFYSNTYFWDQEILIALEIHRLSNLSIDKGNGIGNPFLLETDSNGNYTKKELYELMDRIHFDLVANKTPINAIMGEKFKIAKNALPSGSKNTKAIASSK